MNKWIIVIAIVGLILIPTTLLLTNSGEERHQEVIIDIPQVQLNVSGGNDINPPPDRDNIEVYVDRNMIKKDSGQLEVIG